MLNCPCLFTIISHCVYSPAPVIRSKEYAPKPEVVALAHELGAYDLPDREYAETAYWWMKTNMWYEVSGFDGSGGPK
jgi:hypothetical protein